MDNIINALAREYCDLLADEWEEGRRFHMKRATEFATKQPAIAALPELMEAVRELLATHPAAFRQVSEIDNRTDNAVRIARAALAKATGKEG